MKWILITLKQYPIFARWWIHEAFFYDMKQTLGMRFKNYKSLYSGTYADSREFERLKKLLIKKLDKDIDSIWSLCKHWETDCNDLLKFTKHFETTNFSKFSDKQLLELVNKSIKKLRRSASYIYLSTTLDQYFQDWLSSIVDKKIQSPSKRVTYFQVLSSATRNTKLLEAQHDLIKLANIVRTKGPYRAKKFVQKYTIKYSWLGYDTAIGKDLTVAETESKIKSILLQRERKVGIPDRKTIVAQLGLTWKEKNLLRLMGELIYLRTYRVESHMIAGANMRPLLEELARRLSTSYENIVQLTFPEIQKAMAGKKLNLQEIKKRKGKYGLLMLNGKNKIYTGKSVAKIEEKTKIPPGLKELTGLPANPGLVRGRVKIVMGRKDYPKIKNGDILVTKMTNPDFIVVLQKCAGIITDIGGITSHAAIISRELNKPCITGTKYATRILKDGDKVELNANKGVIKML